MQAKSGLQNELYSLPAPVGLGWQVSEPTAWDFSKVNSEHRGLVSLAHDKTGAGNRVRIQEWQTGEGSGRQSASAGASKPSQLPRRDEGSTSGGSSMGRLRRPSCWDNSSDFRLLRQKDPGVWEGGFSRDGPGEIWPTLPCASHSSPASATGPCWGLQLEGRRSSERTVISGWTGMAWRNSWCF